VAQSILNVKTFNLHVVEFFSIAVIVFFLACQDIKQIGSQLPNPIRDFTEKDPYIIGLRWYEYGEYDIARKYWEPLAKDGDCDAEFSFGLLYFEGRAVSKSYEKATEWWTKAAKQGQPQAQVALGVMYSQSEVPYSPFQCRRRCGVSKDLVTAYKWFGVAGASGFPQDEHQAKRLINEIKRDMAPEQIRMADLLIKEWKPDPSACVPRRDL
jgi:TPR repeat protein